MPRSRAPEGLMFVVGWVVCEGLFERHPEPWVSIQEASGGQIVPYLGASIVGSRISSIRYPIG
jgi:hypothetical protein